MKVFARVILVLVGAVTGLCAITAVGYGTLGVFVVLFLSNPGFVGEGDFYASALLLISLAMMATGAVSGIVSYICWARCRRHPA